MATLAALIQALPKIVALFQFLTAMVRDAEQRGLGRQEAINEALTLAHRQLAEADAAEQEAEAAHAAHPDSDDAFDPEFRRKD